MVMVEIAMGFAVNYFFVIIWALQIEAKKAGILFSVKKDTGLDAAGVVRNHIFAFKGDALRSILAVFPH